MLSGNFTLRRHAAADGALTAQTSIPVSAALVVAAANRVAVLGASSRDCTHVLASFDHGGRPLSSVTLGPCTAGLVPAALALAPDGAAVLAGQLLAPFDFSTGTTFAPRGRDAFVVELSR